MSKPRISKAWVAMSILLIAGGIFVAHIALFSQGIHGFNQSFAVYALGSLLGGFYAARMTARPTLLEPAIASVFIALSMSAIDQMWEMGVFAQSFDRPAAPASLGAVAFAAALAGARLGARRSSLRESENKLRWAVPALLALLGSGYFMLLCTVIAHLLLGDDAVFFFVISPVLAPVIAGVFVQLAAPYSVGSTFLIAGFLGTVGLFALCLSHDSDVLFFIWMGGMLCTFVVGFLAYLGARIGKYGKVAWGDPLRVDQPAAAVPKAQVHERDASHAGQSE